MDNNNTPFLSACEEDYQQLQNQLARHRESATQRPNLEALDKLITVILDDMKTKGVDVIPPSAKYLFTTACVDDCVYDRNFRTINGIILVLKGVLVDGIDKKVVRTFGVSSYEDGLTRLFGYLSVPSTDTDYNSIRLRFAVLRFSDDFWGIALHFLYPFVVKNWMGFDFSTREFIYQRYIACFRIVLKYWLEHDFSSNYIDKCLLLLNKLTALSVQEVTALQAYISNKTA